MPTGASRQHQGPAPDARKEALQAIEWVNPPTRVQAIVPSPTAAEDSLALGPGAASAPGRMEAPAERAKVTRKDWAFSHGLTTLPGSVSPGRGAARRALAGRPAVRSRSSAPYRLGVTQKIRGAECSLGAPWVRLSRHGYVREAYRPPLPEPS